jgi:hypothetical protein
LPQHPRLHVPDRQEQSQRQCRRCADYALLGDTRNRHIDVARICAPSISRRVSSSAVLNLRSVLMKQSPQRRDVLRAAAPDAPWPRRRNRPMRRGGRSPACRGRGRSRLRHLRAASLPPHNAHRAPTVTKRPETPVRTVFRGPAAWQRLETVETAGAAAANILAKLPMDSLYVLRELIGPELQQPVRTVAAPRGAQVRTPRPKRSVLRFV